jgi:NADH-quinone oxidoreductase subunit N
LRVLFGTSAPGWFWIIWVAAVLSMTLGNLGALMQSNVKRLLAYSSIAQAGYILVAFAAQSQAGISAAMFYAASYAAMNVGAFVVISYFARNDERYTSVNDYAGLGHRSPLLAATLTVFLLSLIGIPLTGGFYAKYLVFTASIGSGLIGLTIIGLMNSAVAAYYYLRLVVVMYMREPGELGSEANDAPRLHAPATIAVTLLLAVAATIWLGVAPGRVFAYANQGSSDLVPKANTAMLPSK